MTREEAIEVYYGLINQKIKEAFEFFAPELAGSEDERIRQGIVETIKQCPDTFLNPKNRDKMLAYLEKQKEQKPEEWSEADERNLRDAKEILLNYGYSGLANWLKLPPPQLQGCLGPKGDPDPAGVKIPVWRKNTGGAFGCNVDMEPQWYLVRVGSYWRLATKVNTGEEYIPMRDLNELPKEEQR